MNASITGYAFDASGTDPRSAMSLSIYRGESGRIDIAVKHRDGTAYNLASCQVQLVVKLFGVTKISRQATITDQANGLGYFPIEIGDTYDWYGSATGDIHLTDQSNLSAIKFYDIVKPGSFAVLDAVGDYSQSVTVPASQQPLAQGPTGPSGGGTGFVSAQAQGTRSEGGNLGAGDGANINTFTKYQPAEVAAPPWQQFNADYANGYGTRRDQKMSQGWNIDAAGRKTTGEAAFAMTVESYYQPTNIRQVLEFYFESYDNAGTYYRPFSIDVDRINGAAPVVAVSGGIFQINQSGTTTALWKWTADASGTCEVSGNAAVIVHHINNKDFYVGTDSVGTTHSLITFENSNRLVLCKNQDIETAIGQNLIFYTNGAYCYPFVDGGLNIGSPTHRIIATYSKGLFSAAYRSAATPVTVGNFDRYVGVSGSGARSVALPVATFSCEGTEVVIQEIGNSAGVITIAPNGTDKINGVAGSITISAAFGAKTLVSDGVSNWYAR
jgi:hypothetical protein